MSPRRRSQGQRSQKSNQRQQPKHQQRNGNSGQGGNNRNGANNPQPAEFWKAAPLPSTPEPIRPAADPAALLRSLGTPPLTGQNAVSDHYMAAVVVRASNLATALAAATGLLATDDD